MVPLIQRSCLPVWHPACSTAMLLHRGNPDRLLIRFLFLKLLLAQDAVTGELCVGAHRSGSPRRASAGFMSPVRTERGWCRRLDRAAKGAAAQRLLCIVKLRLKRVSLAAAQQCISLSVTRWLLCPLCCWSAVCRLRVHRLSREISR